MFDFKNDDKDVKRVNNFNTYKRSLIILSLIVVTFISVLYLCSCTKENDNANPPEYSISYIADTGGYIEGETNQVVDEGERGEEVKAVPYEGYEFVKWSDGITTSARNELNVTSDITVTAVFEKITYSIFYETDGNGTIDGETSQTVAYGESATAVTAVPAEGYKFVKWSDGNTNQIRQEINVKADIHLTAIFEKVDVHVTTFTVSYTTNGNGTIDGETSQTVEYGKNSASVTAIPNDGYIFVEWSDGLKTATRQETNVIADVHLTAIFEKVDVAVTTFTVSYITDGNGTISGETSQTVEYGKSSVSVTAIPNEGYRFVEWSDGLKSATRRETWVKADISVTATFEKITYTVTYVVLSVYGGILGQGKQTIAYGEDCTAVTAVPNENYKFVQWSDGNTNPTRQETNVKANISITAIFEKLTFTITYTTDGNGTIEGAATQTLEYGKQYSAVTAVPNEGYKFVQWSDGNTFFRRYDLAYEDKTVTAIFEEMTLKVTYMVSGGYLLVDGERVEPSYAQYVNYGENMSKKIEVVPYDYRQSFIKWSDGVETEERQDLNVTENIYVEAILGIKLIYKVDGNKGGKIIGECNQIVDVGKDANKVIAVPDEGYIFGGWSDLSFDLERQEKNAIATFEYIAYFEPIEKTFKYDYGELIGTPLQDKVVINRYKLNAVNFVLPEMQGYTFCGWYTDKDYTMKLANENGKLMLGYYTFNLETDTIYAKWESDSAEEKLTYKILMIHVDSLQASPYSDKLGKNVDVDYKMTTLERKILALNTIRFQLTMNSWFSERETNFQIEMYFTTDLLEPDMPVAGDYSSVYGKYISEVTDITDVYGSVITVFGLRNWNQLSKGVAGMAYIKYAALNIDSFFEQLRLDYTPLHRIYESLLEVPDGFYKAELYVHEFTHTIEVHYHLGIIGMVTVVEYHEILDYGNPLAELDNYIRTKLYLLCEFEMDGEKVGIPRDFWENPSYWEEEVWWYSNTLG